jgi:hypothetical protein
MGVRGETVMKPVFLTALLLACALGCRSSTLIGVADAAADAGGCGVSYPQTGFYGLNILYPGLTSFPSVSSTSSYELAADHAAGATVTLNMTLLSGTVWDIGAFGGDWRFTTYDYMTGEQTFSTPNVAGGSESSMFFSGNGEARLDLFECGSTTPTSSKTITWYDGTDGGPGVVVGRDGAVSGVDGAAVVGRDATVAGLDGAAIDGHD